MAKWSCCMLYIVRCSFTFTVDCTHAVGFVLWSCTGTEEACEHRLAFSSTQGNGWTSAAFLVVGVGGIGVAIGVTTGNRTGTIVKIVPITMNVNLIN